MTAYRLDEFVKSLQSTADKTQKTLDEHQAAGLRKVVNLDQNGQPEFLTLECRLPSGDGGKRTYEMLRMPWASLYPPESMGVTELSVEFNCDIKKARPGSQNSQPKYTLTPTKQKQADKKQGHEFKVHIKATNDFASETTIDKLPLDDFLDRLDGSAPDKEKWYSLETNNRKLIFLLFILLLAAIIAIVFIIN